MGEQGSAKGIKKTEPVFQKCIEPAMKEQLMLRRVSRVKFTQGALRDPLQHFFGEDSEQLPANVQSLINSAVFIRTLDKIEIE